MLPPLPRAEGWVGCKLQRAQLSLHKSSQAVVCSAAQSPLRSRGVPRVSKAAFTPKEQESQPGAEASGRQMCVCLRPLSRAPVPPPCSMGARFKAGSRGIPTAPAPFLFLQTVCTASKSFCSPSHMPQPPHLAQSSPIGQEEPPKGRLFPLR